MKTNIKNIINNIYFKKTLSSIFDQLNPKFERVNHIVLKGQSLSNILEKYSVTNNELKLIQKSLIKKYFFKFVEEFKKQSLYADSSDFITKRLKKTGV